MARVRLSASHEMALVSCFPKARSRGEIPPGTKKIVSDERSRNRPKSRRSVPPGFEPGFEAVRKGSGSGSERDRKGNRPGWMLGTMWKTTVEREMACAMACGMDTKGTLGWRRRIRTRCEAKKGDGEVFEWTKRVAKKYAGDGKTTQVVGLGQGKLPAAIVQSIAEETDGNVVAIPTSARAAAEAALHGMRIGNLVDHPTPDVSFAVADEIDQVEGSLPAICGRFDGEIHVDILGERNVAMASKKHIVLVEAINVVEKLGGSVPVVIPLQNWEDVAEELDDLFLGIAEIRRHPTRGTSDPRGGPNPYFNDAGQTVVDVVFERHIYCTPFELAEMIEGVPGVLGHGLLLDCIDTAYAVQGDEVKELVPYLKDVDKSVRKNLMGDA